MTASNDIILAASVRRSTATRLAFLARLGRRRTQLALQRRFGAAGRKDRPHRFRTEFDHAQIPHNRTIPHKFFCR